MASLKLKEAQTAPVFDEHAGRRNCSRTSNTYSNAGQEGRTYVPEGRLRAFQLPSRMGNRLHYPDGTVTETDHGKQPANP